jgi:YHS domain-containing protein
VNYQSILFLAASLSLVACGGAATPVAANGASANGTAASAGIKAPGEAKIGDKTLCPVSKEEFTVTESSPKLEHDGKTYYFCCGGCSGKFKENPTKFLGASKT